MVFRRLTSAVLSSPRGRNGRQLLFLTAALGLVAGCDGAPQGPTAVPVPASVSGHVYQRPTAELGEPMLPDVLITIERADGSQCTTRTDAGGFYIVSVTRGTISISAAKAGYETKRWEFELSSDTVLNFSLAPSTL
jgi:hypothetical protein